MFFYKKNIMAPIQYEKHGTRNTKNTELEQLYSHADEEFCDVFSLEKLIKRINDYYDYHSSEDILSQVLKWKFDAKENILKILCDLGHERIASKFMFDHEKWADKDFFFYCVHQEKSYFLKHALRN